MFATHQEQNEHTSMRERSASQRYSPPLLRRTCIFVSMLLCACASPTPKPVASKPVEIVATADTGINRDVRGKPLSVGIYQLKDSKAFAATSFEQFASGRPDTELLGPELAEKAEVILLPGGRHASSTELKPETKYIGIVAFFRQPDPHYWRFLVDADKVRKDGLSFRVQECHLRLIHPAPAEIRGQPANAAPACAPSLPLRSGSG